MAMAEDALGTMIREKDLSLRFSVSACYYAMYYSLYAILMKIGVKCEIHSCTLRCMEEFLREFYSADDMSIITKAFRSRNTIQYYVDRVLDKQDIDFIITKAPLFNTKSKGILAKINERDTQRIRLKLSAYIDTQHLSQDSWQGRS